MSFGKCETVKIISGDSYKIINKEDLSDKDKIYQQEEKKAPKKKAKSD